MSQSITIELKKTRHASQPWTVTIHVPRKEPVRLRQRYATRRNARRGALRSINAVDNFGDRHPNYPERLTYFVGRRHVKFNAEVKPPVAVSGEPAAITVDIERAVNRLIANGEVTIKVNCGGATVETVNKDGKRRTAKGKRLPQCLEKLLNG